MTESSQPICKHEAERANGNALAHKLPKPASSDLLPAETALPNHPLNSATNWEPSVQTPMATKDISYLNHHSGPVGTALA